MEQRKNILMLLTDQHRWDCFGANTGLVQTPNLDGLAEDGVRFTSGYTCNPLCSPARASILTGQYPHEHKVIVNTGDFNGLSSRLDPARPTFMSRLSVAGYRVGYCGKWHLGPRRDCPPGVDVWQNMDLYYKMLRDRGIDWTMWDEDKGSMTGPDATFYSKLPISEELAPAAWVADRTIEILDEFAASETPFCIYVSWYGPHFPTTVPEPYFSMYDPESIERPKNFDEDFANKPRVQEKERRRWNAEIMTWPKWQQVIARYRGFCTFIDHHVGRILDRLRELGEYDNTLIIFTADHGGMMGNHTMFNKGFHFYEETVRIPFAARLPRGARGKVYDSFVSNVDICPTVLDYAGLPMIEPMHGLSMLPLLRGEGPESRRDFAFTQFHGYETSLCTQRMLRTRKYKYCYNPMDLDELYDLEEDPDELVNLAVEALMQPVIEELRRKLHDIMVKYGENCINTCAYGVGENRRITGRWDD